MFVRGWDGWSLCLRFFFSSFCHVHGTWIEWEVYDSAFVAEYWNARLWNVRYEENCVCAREGR